MLIYNPVDESTNFGLKELSHDRCNFTANTMFCGVSSGDLREVMTGTWHINGNGTYGELVVTEIVDGKLTGTIYGQPIDGTFDEDTAVIAGIALSGKCYLCPTIAHSWNNRGYQGNVIATLANDVGASTLATEIGFPNFRLLLLTLADGRAFVCSYMIHENGVEIAYPHTTSCHRGSGQIIFLQRPTEQP